MVMDWRPFLEKGEVMGSEDIPFEEEAYCDECGKK